MLRRIFFDSRKDSDSPEVPSIIITDQASQPEAAPQRGLRRTAAVSNLASLDEQFSGSSVTIIHRLNAVTVTATHVEHQAATTVQRMRRGYELEDNSYSISQRLVCFDDAEESSSDYEIATRQDTLREPAEVRSTSNSPDPDSLDKIWFGRVSP